MANKFKKLTNDEKDFSKTATTSFQPPIFENLPLVSGVTLTFEGRKR